LDVVSDQEFIRCCIVKDVTSDLISDALAGKELFAGHPWKDMVESIG